MRPSSLVAMIRKDLLVFFSDRRAVIMTFIAPIAIASFFGSIFSGDNREPAKVAVGIVDHDRSAVSGRIVSAVQGDARLRLTTPDEAQARESVRTGSLSVAVVIPEGFGAAAGRAMFTGQGRPELVFLYDPSRAMELGFTRGLLTEHVMQSVSEDVFSGAGGQRTIDETLRSLDASSLPAERKATLRSLMLTVQQLMRQNAGDQRPAGFSLPYAAHEEAVTTRNNAPYNGYAHSFAGMSIQALLFIAIDLGVGVLLERQRGLWKRLRSAPLSRVSLLVAKAFSATVISLMCLLVSFGFAMAVFGVRIHGNAVGFVAVAVACALMTSTFGLLIASIGKTPGGTRGVSILAVLMMVMLGGAWVPTFVFPQWVQRLTVVVPARWAVDGFDAMTWRGLGAAAALRPVLVLLAFALVFGSLAVTRFRWEEA